MNLNWLTALKMVPQPNETITDICERSLSHDEYTEIVESKLFAAWLVDEFIPTLN